MDRRILIALACSACSAGTFDLEGEAVPPPAAENPRLEEAPEPAEPVTPARMPTEVTVETPPPPPVGSAPIVALGLGRRHTCAVDKRGALFCWGASERGQLGRGSTDAIGDDETPREVSKVPVEGFVADVAAGHHHTCAMTSAGDVLCFGIGALGQLGYGATADIGDDETPTDFVDIGGRAIDIAAGETHTCVLRDDGVVRCFGEGADGRLGYGDEVNVGDDETPFEDVDVGLDVIAIAAGAAHTCALGRSGDVRCWGENDDGRLGGNPVDALTPIDVALDEPAVAIDAGTSHTCALLSSGRVYCFGVDMYGELGTSGGMIDLDAPVVEVSAGNFRTCVRFESGAARCWGYPFEGGLGVASTNYAASPRDAEDVGLGASARAIASGMDHSCAIVEGGTVRCWGAGDDGRLGYASEESVGDDELPMDAGDVDLN